MWRKGWLGVIVLFLSLLIFPSEHVYAAENAYVSCLYDEETMCYRTSVVFSGDEVELSLLKKFTDGTNYFGVQLEDKDSTRNCIAYLNGSPTPIIQAIVPGNFCGFMLSETFYRPTCVQTFKEDADLSRATDNPNAITSVCTFPTNYHHNATQADINRAYEVADVLGGDLTKALIFLNDEKSYTTVGDKQYLYQMRYNLLKGLENKVEYINAYGSKYMITPNGDTITIKKLGHFEKWTPDTSSASGGDWDASSFVEDYRQIERTFVWRMSKGYKQKANSGKTEGVYFLDGYKGMNLLDSGVYSDLKIDDIEDALGGTYEDKISWVHLLVEADLALNAGITYQTSSDLYAFDSTSNEMITKIVNTAQALESSLDCYSISDLVFNGGVFATDGYYYGCFPSEWLTYIQTFYVIFAVIALSLVTLSLTLSLGRNIVSSASANARFTLMQDVSNLFITALFIVVGLGLINIMFYMSDLIVSIFADIATASGRTIESLQPTRNGHNLATALMQYGYFGLKVYINITYVMRRFLLMGMMAAAPIFIIAFSFGQKGKEITMRWLSELIGHITIQPVQAATLAVILTVSTGLRGVESVALLCCILPLTNFYRGLITKGGNFAIQQGSKLGGSLVTQQASMMGAQAMIDATEEGKTMGQKIGGAGAVAVGGLTALATGNLAAGLATGAGTYSALSKVVSDSYRVEGQAAQSAYQTAGSMANMVASGGEESGVSAGINGMVNARIAKVDSDMAKVNMAMQTASSIGGAIDTSIRHRQMVSSVRRGDNDINSGGLSSGGSFGDGLSSGGSPSGVSFGGGGESSIRSYKTAAETTLNKTFGGGVKATVQTDSAGQVTGGTATIKPPGANASPEQKQIYSDLRNALNLAQSQSGGLYNNNASRSVEATAAVQNALVKAGLGGGAHSQASLSGNTIKVQIDSSQMAELIKGVSSPQPKPH